MESWWLLKSLVCVEGRLGGRVKTPLVPNRSPIQLLLEMIDKVTVTTIQPRKRQSAPPGPEFSF